MVLAEQSGVRVGHLLRNRFAVGSLVHADLELVGVGRAEAPELLGHRPRHSRTPVLPGDELFRQEHAPAAPAFPRRQDLPVFEQKSATPPADHDAEHLNHALEPAPLGPQQSFPLRDLLPQLLDRLGAAHAVQRRVQPVLREVPLQLHGRLPDALGAACAGHLPPVPAGPGRPAAPPPPPTRRHASGGRPAPGRPCPPEQPSRPARRPRGGPGPPPPPGSPGGFCGRSRPRGRGTPPPPPKGGRGTPGTGGDRRARPPPCRWWRW